MQEREHGEEDVEAELEDFEVRSGHVSELGCAGLFCIAVLIIFESMYG